MEELAVVLAAYLVIGAALTHRFAAKAKKPLNLLEVLLLTFIAPILLLITPFISQKKLDKARKNDD